VMREDFGPSGDGHRRQQNSEDVLHGVCSITPLDSLSLGAGRNGRFLRRRAVPG
jgi:hypothetical protein